MLTGNKDIDRKILNNLEDKDLVNVCQVNKKAQSICNDQVFWMNRVFLRFGYVGGDVLRSNKGNRTWSEYYIKDLRKINSTNADEYLRNGSIKGRLDYVIISLVGHGANIHIYSNQALRLAIMEGYLEVVKYLIEFGADTKYFNDYVRKVANRRGYLDIIKYLDSL